MEKVVSGGLVEEFIEPSLVVLPCNQRSLAGSKLELIDETRKLF